jgi:PAS domain S-box-containing protein
MTLVHPQDLERVREVFWRSVKERQPYDIRYRVCVASGKVKHLHLQGETHHEGDVAVRTVGTVVDETDLVLAQIERDRLVSVMENTTDIVSMADAQGRVFYFNRAGYDMLGLKPGQPLEGVIREVHPPWAARLVHDEGIPAAMAEGRWLGETAILNAQGDEVPMSQLIMSHRDPDGQIDYLWTILRDISERKTAEAALELERTQLAQAQAVAHVGSWTMFLAEKRLMWSDENYRVLGFEPQSVEPSLDAFLSVVHPDDLPMVLAKLDRDTKSKVSLVSRFEHRIVTSSGVRHVEQRASVEVDSHGQVVRMVGTTMDVTERMLAEQALREAKDMLEKGEAVSRMGSFAYDSDTGELRWSRQAFATIGLPYSPQPPSIDEYCACIHPDDVERVRASIGRLVAGADVPEVRFRTHPDRGPVRWLRRLFQRIDRSAQGLKPRFIGTLQDITDAVQAEEQLRRVNQELEQRVTERTAQLSQANQELEAFSYTVSHDLKAPLRGIDGYSQLLVEEYGDRLDADGRQFVWRIRHGVQLMGELINDLLEYSRMERRDMAAEPVSLLPLVQQVLDGYEVDIRQQGAQVQLAMESFTLALDREGIAVVLRNLIGNALKFSRDRQPPRVEIGSRSEAGRRILWVRDNGVGFDMKYHDRMFGIFQRLHRAEEFPGTGVGLALVFKAVQRMGGRVWAESTLGAGATFFLEFPE